MIQDEQDGWNLDDDDVPPLQFTLKEKQTTHDWKIRGRTIQ